MTLTPRNMDADVFVSEWPFKWVFKSYLLLSSEATHYQIFCYFMYTYLKNVELSYLTLHFLIVQTVAKVLTECILDNGHVTESINFNVEMQQNIF